MLNRTATDYVIASAVGAVIVVVVGYFVFASGNPGISFTFWLWHREGQVAAWLAVGIATGSALRYLRR